MTVPGFRERNGLYYFDPTRHMRRAGFSGVPFQKDKRAALEYCEKQYKEFQEIRKAEKTVDERAIQGTFKWLIDEFQNDPTWYKQKALATQWEMDYAFKIIEQKFSSIRVKIIKTRQCRGFYNKLRVEGSVHKARKVMKWFHRLMKYAIELGVRDDNPSSNLNMETPVGRSQRWVEQDVFKVIKAADEGGKAKSGNIIPPRPSVGLATYIAYDTSLPQQDVLAIRWTQYDGEGVSVTQIKPRGKKEELWIPLSDGLITRLNTTPKTSPYIIISEETGQPYLNAPGSTSQSGRNVFGRLFRRFRKRAGVQDDLRFHDLRRTALSELGDRGGTNAEIVSFSGHNITSRVLNTYVKPGRQAALNARRKRDGK